MNSVGVPPAEIPGYQGGPLSHQPERLDEPLFYIGHLYGCVHSPEAEEALFGADYEASEGYHRELMQAGQWPVFEVPLAGGHKVYIVYRTFEGDPGIDYLVHHPEWDVAEVIASDEGHFRGPGLSWAELTAAAFSGIPGGSTDDPRARLLLLLPAFGDARAADDATATVAQALDAHTHVEDAQLAAEHLLEGQGPAGPAYWTENEAGVWVCDGRYAYRSVAALPQDRLARISAALSQPQAGLAT